MVHTTKLLSGLKSVCPDEWCELEWQERVFKEVIEARLHLAGSKNDAFL
jgi:hypothetical protein